MLRDGEYVLLAMNGCNGFPNECGPKIADRSCGIRTVDATRDLPILLSFYSMDGIARTPLPRLARKRKGEV